MFYGRPFFTTVFLTLVISASYAQSQSEYDAVIVGAGPAGLATAIRLQSQGLNVMVLEKRPFLGSRAETNTSPWGTRHRHVALDLEILHSLLQLTQNQLEHSPFTYLRVLSGREASQSEIVAPSALTDALFQVFFQRRPGGVANISDVEHYLFSTAKKVGVEFLYGVEVQRFLPHFEGFQIKGLEVPIKAQRYIIASGAHAFEAPWFERFKTLYLDRTVGELEDRKYTVTNFKVPHRHNGSLTLSAIQNPDEPSASVSLVNNGIMSVYYTSLSDHELNHKEIIQRRAQDFAPGAIALDEGSDFFVPNRHLVNFVNSSGRLIIIGDAAGTFDVIAGTGLNKAIGDSQRVADFVRHNDRDQFNKDMLAATERSMSTALSYQFLYEAQAKSWIQPTTQALRPLVPLTNSLCARILRN